MIDVYISCDPSDRLIAVSIANALEESGFKTFVEDLPFIKVKDLLTDQLKKVNVKEGAKIILVIWSRASAASTWVKEAILVALEGWETDRLLLVRLDDAKLPVGLRDINHLDVSDGSNSKSIRSIVDAVLHRFLPREEVTLQNLRSAEMRLEAERREAERLERERLEAERLEPERLEAERLERERLEAERLEPERLEAERLERERLEAERLEPERLKRERLEIAASPRASAIFSGAAAFILIGSLLALLSFALGWWLAGSGLVYGLGYGLIVFIVVSVIMLVVNVFVADLRRKRLQSLASAQTQHRDNIARSLVTEPRRQSLVTTQTQDQDQHEGTIVPSQIVLFISYSRDDKPMVSVIVDELERSGLKTWLDTRHKAEAQRFAKAIVQAIQTSKACAFMCSPAAYQSDHVVRELYLADKYKKPIIPVEIEPCSPTEDFEYFFSGFNFVSAVPTEECVQAIMRRLNDN